MYFLKMLITRKNVCIIRHTYPLKCKNTILFLHRNR